MFAESKLTFAAWKGLGITAASIGTVVYQRSGGFGSLQQKNSGTEDKLIKGLDLGNSGKKDHKEEDKKQSLPKSEDKDLKVQEKKPDLEASKPEEENVDESLDQKNNQGEDKESFGSGMQSFTLGSEDDDQLELETKK